MSENALQYIDQLGASIADINDLSAAIQKLGYSVADSATLLEEMFQLLEQGADLSYVISSLFHVAAGSEAYNKILNAFDTAFGTTLLNMGQNVDKLNNSIDSLYAKASEWNTLSKTEQTQFISEHQDLFSGPTGEALLRAFESGNYMAIESALRSNEALAKQRVELLKDVNRQLEIEYARAEEERNYAYIRILEESKKELENEETFYLASLETRKKQQDAQLEAYRDYLQKENDALTASLDKRKEAYQKYFDAINQEKEDEDYEENAQRMIANISKLSSSTNADAMAKAADLTKQLEDLEKERLQTLRERAQEAIIQKIEDKVTKINDNLEKLLNNEQALLTALTNDAANPSALIASMMSARYISGDNTGLGMQSYLKEMEATFGTIMPNIDWSDVSVRQEGNTVILNIEGKEIVLTEGEQQSVYDAIDNALRQIGK